MRILLMVPGLLTAILLIVLAFMIKYKKSYRLIAGFKKMPEEKIKHLDIEGLGRLISGMLYFIAGLIIVFDIFIFIDIIPVPILVFLLFIFMIPTVLFVLIKSQKYYNNTLNGNGKMKKNTKTIIWVTAVMVLVAFGIGVLFINIGSPSNVNIEDNKVVIHGLFGETFPVSEITKVEIKETIPDIKFRAYGSSFGSILKGSFQTKDLGKVRMYVDTSKKQFIYIERKKALTILNFKDSVKNKEFYNSLKGLIR